MTARQPRPAITDLAEWAGRARRAQAALDELGAGRPPLPPPPPMPEPVRVPRTPPAPRGWPAAAAGTCSHGGHGWDGETCDEIAQPELPGMPATALVPGDAMGRAETIAVAMTDDPEATPSGDDPWTPSDVIGVALARGLELLEQLYGVTP